MRRADRLFQLVETLRRRRTAITGAALAEVLGVSLRTLYRDVRDLISRGVPIEGEAGVGYRLRGYDLPPITFDQDEIEALVLGARIVESWADPQLAQAARAAIGKIESSLPEPRRSMVEGAALYAPSDHRQVEVGIDLAALRRAIRDSRKVAIDYVDAKDDTSTRIIHPLAMAFFGPVWMVPAWCELRQAFRVFRPDRMRSLDVLDARFTEEPGRDLSAFMSCMRPDRARLGSPH